MCCVCFYTFLTFFISSLSAFFSQQIKTIKQIYCTVQRSILAHSLSVVQHSVESLAWTRRIYSVTFVLWFLFNLIFLFVLPTNTRTDLRFRQVSQGLLSGRCRGRNGCFGRPIGCRKVYLYGSAAALLRALFGQHHPRRPKLEGNERQVATNSGTT